MSISTVPYTCPRRSAKSSTPSTATAPTGGSGSLRIMRSRVERLAASPSWAPSRAAARPANANPAAVSIRPKLEAASGIPAGQPGDLLGEGPLRTVRGVAEQPPDPEGDRYRCPADRGVGHPASVAAVHPCRTRPAPRTAAFPSDRGRGDHHPTRQPLDPLDMHPFELRKQQLQRLTFTLGT